MPNAAGLLIRRRHDSSGLREFGHFLHRATHRPRVTTPALGPICGARQSPDSSPMKALYTAGRHRPCPRRRADLHFPLHRKIVAITAARQDRPPSPNPPASGCTGRPPTSKWHSGSGGHDPSLALATTASTPDFLPCDIIRPPSSTRRFACKNRSPSPGGRHLCGSGWSGLGRLLR